MVEDLAWILKDGTWISWIDWRLRLASSYMNQLLRVLRILAFTFLAGSQAGYGHESGNDVAELSLSIWDREGNRSFPVPSTITVDPGQSRQLVARLREKRERRRGCQAPYREGKRGEKEGARGKRTCQAPYQPKTNDAPMT